MKFKRTACQYVLKRLGDIIVRRIFESISSDYMQPRPYVWEAALFNILKPTGYVMHQQFNIQQLYVLPTLYLCVLYLSENKQRLVPLTA